MGSEILSWLCSTYELSLRRQTWYLQQRNEWSPSIIVHLSNADILGRHMGYRWKESSRGDIYRHNIVLQCHYYWAICKCLLLYFYSLVLMEIWRDVWLSGRIIRGSFIPILIYTYKGGNILLVPLSTLRFDQHGLTSILIALSGYRELVG